MTWDFSRLLYYILMTRMYGYVGAKSIIILMSYEEATFGVYVWGGGIKKKSLAVVFSQVGDSCF